jgi:hypothetical protein
MATRLEEVPTTTETPEPTLEQPTTLPEAQTGTTETELERAHAYAQSLADAMRSLNQQLNTVSQENETLRRTVQTPAEVPKTAEENRQRFFEDPMSLISEAMDRQLQPIREKMNVFERAITVSRGNMVAKQLVARLKLKPQFARIWNPAIEAKVEEWMANVTEDKTTEDMVNSAIIQAVGLSILEPATTPTPESTTVERSIPSHVRPSAAPTPDATRGAPKRRNLTEAEAIVARRQWPGKTVEEQKNLYLDWLELPADQVVSTRIGKEPIK